ncbi:MAG: CAP domain-containing protein [Rothia sp. (in: high G+C Gram-positive bacteria)]|nr:CAP domain-containing protein [Rothia sp. (in: high G+C Gram-positive bacteria)]
MKKQREHAVANMPLKRRQLGLMTLAAVGCAAAASSNIARAAASDLREVSAGQRASDTQTLLGLMNTYRAQNGLGPLSHSASLAAVMEQEARRQVLAGAVSHSTIFMTDPRVQGNTFAREIIALSYNDDLNELLSFWKSSPTHNAALLSPQATVCGIGLAYAQGNGLPWRILGNVGLWSFANGAPADTAGAAEEATAANAGQQDSAAEQVAQQEAASQPAQKSKAAQEPELEEKQLEKEAEPEPIAIKGAIAERYHADGGEAKYGLPTAPELPISDGGSYQTFSKDDQPSLILWNGKDPAYAIKLSSPIGKAWVEAGSEFGHGYPRCNEYKFGIYSVQDFDAGVLTCNKLTGEVKFRKDKE